MGGPPTFESGVGVRTTYDISKCYVLGRFEDKSRAMLATFTLETDDPYSAILDYLGEHFNPGTSAAAKANGVELFLLMLEPTQEGRRKTVAAGFLAMLNKIVLFRVSAFGILAAERHGFEDKALLELNLVPTFPLKIGRKGHILGSKDLLHLSVNQKPK
jgi:hypothetical protein